MSADPAHRGDGPLSEDGPPGSAPGRRIDAPEAAGRLVAGLWKAWRSIAIGVATLSAFRVAFLLRHGAPGGAYPGWSLARAFAMGARFDLKTAAVAFLPLVLLVAFSQALGRLRALPLVWAALAFLALDVAAMVNDGYYGFFHTPIDAIVFGFAEDDTRAVWRSVWEDHPVVLAALSAFSLAALQTALAMRARLAAPPPAAGSPVRSRALARRSVAAVALSLGLFLAIRGRLGTFPLNEQDLAVAPEPFVNAMTPNGAYALFAAWRQRRSVSIGTDPLVGLRRLGFSAPGEAAAALGLAHADASDGAVAEALHLTTRENPVAAARPPHVVIAVMEGWGSDLLDYHSAKNDLLGRLAPHLRAGLLFRRFLSGHNGTHPTLEALLLGTPITPLTYSAFGHRRFEQAAVLPFRAAGYRVAFATGGSSAWRGLARALPQQGFDEVRDQSDVLASVPGARIGTWGVFDHELFAWAAARLREADRKGERLLLVLLTTTAHPPYAVPPEYRVRPLDLSVFSGRRLGEESLRRPILETYQYACDALGGFLDAVREAGLADRTIVAATGDHNTRTFFDYPATADLARRDGVPLFLAVPPAYLAGRSPDVGRWASHRDLFPTLAGLALSRARTFRFGDDLLAPPSRTPRALARYETVLADAGAVEKLGSDVFLRWEGGSLVPCADPACRAPLEAIAREERAYVGLLDWNVRRQALRPGGAQPVAARQR